MAALADGHEFSLVRIGTGPGKVWCDNVLKPAGDSAMDPNEIIKAAPEIAKGAAALGAAIPFTGIVKRMLGPASDEVAEMTRNRIF